MCNKGDGLETAEKLAFRLELWVIYYDPTDFPGLYVARKHTVRAHCTHPSTEFFVAESLSGIRKLVRLAYPHLVCRPRDEEDDPVIVETWL